VLWLSAALAAIAFTLSTTVRGEIDRAATATDGVRAYYLATGALERATVELLWTVRYPDRAMIHRPAVAVDYSFPSGDARVEFLPEAGKLDVNHARPEQLYRLLAALSVEPVRAQEIAMGIVAARQPGGTGEIPPLASTFRRPAASFQEIEELLQVPGVTPDIFYGTWVPLAAEAGQSRLERRAGLADCLTVYGSGEQVDANSATPAVLAAAGLSPFAVNAVVERRRMAPFTYQTLSEFLQAIGAPSGALRVEGNSIVSMRATARLRLAGGRLSDLRRTVAAQVKYMPNGYDSPIHILRWYDNAWSN
jgi:hypothetical protein